MPNELPLARDSAANPQAIPLDKASTLWREESNRPYKTELFTRFATADNNETFIKVLTCVDRRIRGRPHCIARHRALCRVTFGAFDFTLPVVADRVSLRLLGCNSATRTRGIGTMITTDEALTRLGLAESEGRISARRRLIFAAG